MILNRFLVSMFKKFTVNCYSVTPRMKTINKSLILIKILILTRAMSSCHPIHLKKVVTMKITTKTKRKTINAKRRTKKKKILRRPNSKKLY